MASVGGFFKAATPFLASGLRLVGGPAGNIAADILSKVTGTTVKPEDMSKVMEGLASSEEGRLKLVTAEQDYKVAMQKLGFDHEEKLEALATDDRDSARRREETIKDKIPAILAIAVTVGFFGMLALVAFHGVRQESTTLVNIMTATLGAAWMAVMNYYFGSTAGSARKTELIAQADAVKP